MYKTILINKTHPIKESITKKLDLVETKDYEDRTIYIDKETYKMYKELRMFLLKKKINIELSEAYRSIEDQQAIIDDYIEKYGEEYASKYVAPSGTSEHHTGLAIDIKLIDIEKENEELLISTYNEIHKHLSEFGFILRYPKGKEQVTGYNYEPWHLRYVGLVPATIIMNNNLTLEEYNNDFSGILYINKPIGITSFDVVNEISNIFGIKRIGHTGTLDPIAEGVLIVCIGKATKVVELLTAEDKEYIAGVQLGIRTDTYDLDGKVLESHPVPDNLPIEETLNSYKKTYLQEVPIYSAVKVNGKKLYEYARKGEYVELPKKEVTIKEIELLSSEKTNFMFKALVTKGCYIRSLINDICKEMNILGTMATLKRTKQGKVTIEETNTLEDIRNNNYKIHRIEDVLPYKKIEVDEVTYINISHGKELDNKYNIKDKVLFTYNNKLISIYELKDKKLKVWKNFI